MEKIAIGDVEPAAGRGESDHRGLSDILGTTDIAVNHYRLAPGDGFPGGLHAHMDQEEVFVVIKGEATFETMDGEVTVRDGAAIRFPPGEFQSGKNDSESDLTVVALGAPRDTGDVRIPVPCPECGHDTLRLETAEGGLTFVCPDCAAEQIPRDCPACGHADLRLTLSEGAQVVTRCQGCGIEFETPPLRD